MKIMALEPWIETHSGKRMYFLEPGPLMVDIDDIAHSLSLQCRFSGHTSRFYSVAEHCIRVSKVLNERYQNPTLSLQGLLHDATEAYLLDVPSPIKQYLGGYYEMEDNLARVIYAKYLLPYPFPQEVKTADTVMLKNEARHLLPSQGRNWVDKYPTEYEYRGHPFCMSPEQAELAYKEWFTFLVDERIKHEASASAA